MALKSQFERKIWMGFLVILTFLPRSATELGEQLCSSEMVTLSANLSENVLGFHKANGSKFVLYEPQDLAGLKFRREECNCSDPLVVRESDSTMWCDFSTEYDEPKISSFTCINGPGWFANKENCSGFYECNDFGDGAVNPIWQDCGDLYYNPDAHICDFRENAPDYCWPHTVNNCKQGGIFSGPGDNCSNYYICNEDNKTAQYYLRCEMGTAFNGEFCNFIEAVNLSTCEPIICQCQGVYPIAKCSAGLICNEKGLHPDNVICEKGLLFDAGAKQCLLERDVACTESGMQCDREEPLCECEGVYVSSSCGLGYVCLEEGQPPRKEECLNGYFNVDTLSCEREKTSACDVTALRCNRCECTGSYVSSQNCSVGYVCDAHDMMPHIKYCQEGLRFDAKTASCREVADCSANDVHCFISQPLLITDHVFLGMSMLTLVITMVFLVWKRAAVSPDHTALLGTMLFSLLAIKICYVVVLANIGRHRMEPSLGSAGAVLHVLYLNVLLVLAMELTLIYQRSRSQLTSYAFFFPGYFLSWAIPAVIVGITVAKKGNETYLFLVGSSSYFTVDWNGAGMYSFAVSGGVTLLVILSLLAGLLWLWCSNKMEDSDGRLDCDVRVCVGGIPAVLATWSLATLSFSTQEDVASGLFAAFAFLEGLLLMILLWSGLRGQGETNFLSALSDFWHHESRVGPSAPAPAVAVAVARPSISSWGSASSEETGGESAAAAAAGFETLPTEWSFRADDSQRDPQIGELFQTMEGRDWWQYQAPPVVLPRVSYS